MNNIEFKYVFVYDVRASRLWFSTLVHDYDSSEADFQMIKSTDANTAQVNVFYVSVACKLYTIPLYKGCNEYNYYWSYRTFIEIRVTLDQY